MSNSIKYIGCDTNRRYKNKNCNLNNLPNNITKNQFPNKLNIKFTNLPNNIKIAQFKIKKNSKKYMKYLYFVILQRLFCWYARFKGTKSRLIFF